MPACTRDRLLNCTPVQWEWLVIDDWDAQGGASCRCDAPAAMICSLVSSALITLSSSTHYLHVQFHIINIQRRLADFHFAQVTSWEGAKLEHERWMSSHNEQSHWAHRQREDGKRTPAEVLDHMVGHIWNSDHLHRVFFTRRFARWLDRLGYLRFRQWSLFGEEGLAKQQATLWLYGQTLTLEYASTPLTQYTVSFQSDKKRFRTVKLLHRFQTQYRSPQLSLWNEDEVKWLLARLLPAQAPRKAGAHVPPSPTQQLPLFAALDAG